MRCGLGLWSTCTALTAMSKRPVPRTAIEPDAQNALIVDRAWELSTL
jgi:hypothetical protein